MAEVLEVEGIKKYFGEICILNGINLKMEKGEVCGLIGNNGEGKTTLMRIILGLMKPTEGKVNLHMEKSYIGYVPQTCVFTEGYSVKKIIDFFGRLKRADVSNAEQLCKTFNLDFEKKVKKLSPGQQKKIQIILATIGDPVLLVLDEPTAGLDPGTTSEVLKLIEEIGKKGNSILISSHILQDLSKICTKVFALHNGEVEIYEAIAERVKIKVGKLTMYQSERIFDKFCDKELRIEENYINLKLNKKDIPETVKSIVEYGIPIYEITTGNVEGIANIIKEI